MKRVPKQHMTASRWLNQDNAKVDAPRLTEENLARRNGLSPVRRAFLCGRAELGLGVLRAQPYNCNGTGSSSLPRRLSGGAFCLGVWVLPHLQTAASDTLSLQLKATRAERVRRAVEKPRTTPLGASSLSGVRGPSSSEPKFLYSAPSLAA
jgi:hypothetical protein